MQIPKSLLVGCAALSCILPQSLRADDTDAQAKAREALRKKVNDLQPGSTEAAPSAPRAAAPAAVPAASSEDKLRSALREKMDQIPAQPSTTSQPAGAAAKKRPAPTVVQTPAARPTPPAQPTVRPSATPQVATPSVQQQPAPTSAAPSVRQPPAVTPVQPVPTQTPQAVAPSVSPGAAAEVVFEPPPDSELVARQREAVRKKMEQLQVQPPQQVVTRPAPTKPATGSAAAAPVRPRPTVPSVASPGSQPSPVTAQTTPQVPAVQSQAVSPPVATPPVAAETARDNAIQAAELQAATKPKQEKRSKKAPARSALTFTQLEGPASPLSADKHQRLEELLRRYQADEITPAQYHQERAKILAQ